MNSISHIRARLGVTQAAMAEGLGVTQGNVSNYERGQTMPPDVAARLIDYAKTLGFQLTYNDVYGLPATSQHRATDPEPEPGRAGRTPPTRKNIMEMASEQPTLYEVRK